MDNGKTHRRIRTRTLIVLLVWPLVAPLAAVPAPPAGERLSTAPVDYEEPKLLTGTIYDPGSNPPRVLFKFRRTATRSGPTVRVLREYYDPQGTLAARERVVYEADRLLSYALEEPQAGAQGQAVIRPNPKAREGKQIDFAYSATPGNQPKKRNENLRQDTLMNDMIPAFIAAHWVALMHGAAVKCRCIALARAETVGFRFVKDSEATWRGKPVVRLRMEPTSVFIASLVKPIFFTVERDGNHRILQYSGRTTPRIKHGQTWQDLDALTVFDWQ